MAKYIVYGHGLITRGWDLGSAPYQRNGAERIGKEYYTSVTEARKAAMRFWKDGSIKHSFTKYHSVVIYEGGIMDKDAIGAVHYDDYAKVFYWLSNRKRDPKKIYHGRVLNKDGSFSKRSWFDLY